MTTDNPLLRAAALRLPALEARLEEARGALQFLQESGQPDDEGRAALVEAETQLAQMRAALEARGMIRGSE